MIDLQATKFISHAPKIALIVCLFWVNSAFANNAPLRFNIGQENTTQTPAQSTHSNTDPNTADTAPTPNPSVENNDLYNTAPTLLDDLSPSESELSVANTKLLAENARLSRTVDDLTTQVNVLTQERSGQLFIYGAATTFIAFIVGFTLAFNTKKRW